ncbi:MAG TPA: hypothetical protein VGN15_09265 [Ktedonobacteraceae bacterium]|nr:hypothetical protein [Ktedonobacteraceae bacterium]
MLFNTSQPEKTIQTDTSLEPIPLPWGRTYLMCPPDYFEVLYEINPWMQQGVQPDLDLANEQWHKLVFNLEQAGATVKTIPPVQLLPDMVFVANAGLVVAGSQDLIVSRFRYPERQPESKFAADWFRGQGWHVAELPAEADICFEGGGDAFPYRDRLLVGYGSRSTQQSHVALAQMLGIEVLSINLVDPRFYHLDISFCPLDSRRAIVNPAAFDYQSCKAIEQLVPEPLMLTLDEALTFCANSVVVGNVVVMPHCPLRVGRILESWGFEVCVSPVSEFLKAGGAVRCLTLPLDMSIGSGV